MPDPNGNGWKGWLLASLWAVTLALAGVVWSNHDTRISQNEARNDRVVTIEVKLRMTESALGRIERKVDWLVCRSFGDLERCGPLP